MAALAAALAGPALAQEPGRAPRAERGEPLRALVQHREELKLTDRQVARIEEIAARLERTEQPLREKLRAAGLRRPSERASAARPSEAEREAMRQKREELRPVLEELREARRSAMEEARRLLTPEQREAVASRLRERRADRRGALAPRQREQLREHFRAGRDRVPARRG